AAWRACEYPQPMLGYLSDRKLRLFACACCRRIWHLLVREDSRWAVETMERYADGRASQAEWAAAEGRVGVLLRVCHELAPPEVRISGAAALGVWAALGAAWGEQTTAAVRGRRARPPDREALLGALLATRSAREALGLEAGADAERARAGAAREQ